MQLKQSNQELLQIEYLATAATGQNIVRDDGKDVIEGLTKTPKSLPSKYFYDRQGSQLFEEICQLPEYYPTRTEAAILQEYAQEIVAYTGPCELDKFLEKIANVLKAGDYFLLGIDLQKPVAILEAAYNDAQGVTAAFNLNMLSHLNWRFQADFNLDLFSHQAIS